MADSKYGDSIEEWQKSEKQGQCICSIMNAPSPALYYEVMHSAIVTCHNRFAAWHCHSYVHPSQHFNILYVSHSMILCI